ncbi:MAG: hypothetical protein ACR2MP_12170 [Streptosporangiaceae bacterium]
MTLDPVPRSFVAVDIEGYSGRDNLGHLELREALRRVCDEAFCRIRVSPDTRQDQGDAFLILIRPGVSKARLIDDLVRELVTALRHFNRNRLPQARMRLRVALHAGEVHLDGTGFGGESVVAVMRLIEADALRDALKTAPDDLAVIVSEQLHRDVVLQRYRGIDPAEYREVHVSRKQFSQRAWIRVPGLPIRSRPTRGAQSTAPERRTRTLTPRDGSPDDSTAESPVVSPGGVHFGGSATFSGPTSFGGHAAGRDVNIQRRMRDA